MAIAYLGGGGLTDDTSAATIAASFSPTVSSGSLLVAAISWSLGGGGTGTVSSVTDSAGNTWTLLSQASDTTNTQGLQLAYAMNATAGATTVTATFSGSTSFRRITLAEYSGVATASALDTSAVKNNGVNTTAANDVTVGPITTTAAGDLIVCGVMDTANGTNTQTAGTGFTKRNAFGLCALEDLVQGSAGSISGTWTFGTAGRYAAGVAAFKAATGGSPSGTATSSSTASITAGGVVARSTGATQSATASISTAGVVGRSGSTSLAATAAITAGGSVVSGGGAGATLGATGALAATGVVARSTGATLSATGAISAAAVIGVQTSAGITATTSITTAGVVGTMAGASLSATAAITAAGAVSTGPAASASISSTAIISASGVVGKYAGAAIAATANIAAIGTSTALRFFFSPPTHEEPFRVNPQGPFRVLAYHRMTYANSLIQVGGTWTSVRVPPPEVLNDLKEGVTFFRGGYEYVIDYDTAQSLIAAGYSPRQI